ncbi:MAG: U32 family peptidase [Oscillospiraceae bacterium]|nr:U32 family peptidase [Oscillospiraceae bacterium]
MQDKIELLSPAGDPDCLYAAIRYGADAVYLAGPMFGMRAGAANFTQDELTGAVHAAHRSGAKIYVACNTLPRNDEIPALEDFLAFLSGIGADALIVADMGVLAMAKRLAPNVPVHISTQAGVTSYAAASALYDMGASRVVLARELTLDEISVIREKTPPELELEAFVHGAMCMSFSGRCLISQYLTGRDANRGDCPQPCRWRYCLVEENRPGQYCLVEENRPGQYFSIVETGGGSYILNARDLRMIEHIPRLHRAGITCFKLEGRAKSPYYTAMVTQAYRLALDGYYASGCDENYVTPDWITELTEKISHREYSTGFYFGGQPGQETKNGGYIREYEVAAVVDGYHDGCISATQRGKFFAGERLELIQPGKPGIIFTADVILDKDGNHIDSTPHPLMPFRIPFDQAVEAGAYLIRKTKT